MKTIGVILVNWNQNKLTLETIRSLDKCILPKNHKLKIILMDNNSQKESPVELKNGLKSFQNLSFVQLKSNTGFCYANNYGIKLAIQKKCSYVCLCNNDVLVDKNIFIHLTNCLKNNPESKIVTPKIYFSPGREYFLERYSKSQRGKVIWSVGGKIDWLNIYGSNLGIDEVDVGQFEKENKNIDYVSGCFMFTTAGVFNQIGLFDEKYFMYFEDDDLSTRAKKEGVGLIYCPKAFLWHVNSGSSGASSNLHQYFITRNRLYFGMKYASFRTKFALFRESLSRLLSSRERWEKQGILDFYLGKMGRGSWHD